MSLTPGTRLGPYEVVALAGVGGMGEVYRARDERLGRDVAIKVLPPAFSADSDRLARFEREARAAAALNHPNILAVHDVGRHDGAPYIVSELLEGQTLRQRLGDAALSVRRATEYATAIARGLSAAHDKGIVHRDLKPENVFVTADGRVKILDFGLAKLVEAEAVVTESPTRSLDTEPGVVLGTIGYMSPEQVRGQPVDHRTDIFALGAILYEMLAGARAFAGATRADTVAAILDWDPAELPTAERHVPPALARIVERCLDKNAATRFQSAGDLAFALEGLSSPSETVVTSGGDRVGTSRKRLAWALFGLALVAALAYATVIYMNRRAPDVRSFKATILPPPNVRIIDRAGSPARRLALSPDGQRLAFTAAGRDGVIWLWVRRLDSLTAQRLDGTEGAVYPFWSPDSRFIGFFSEDGKRRSKLMKIDVAGGSPATLCELPGTNSTGGTWSRDGVILFGMFGTKEGEIQRVSATGGALSPVTRLDPTTGETRHWSPWFLPDGRRFLYLATGIKGGELFATGLYVGSLDSDERTRLTPGGSLAKYSDGHLLYLRGGFGGSTLMAQRFDPVRLVLTGDAVPIAEGVIAGGPTGTAGAFTVSDNGVLAYQTGSAINSQLTWFDRRGMQLGILGEPGGLYGDLQLSPDGSRATITVVDPVDGNADIGVYDVARGGRTRFTSDTTFDRGALWSPDGQRLVFASSRKDNYPRSDLFVKPAIGTGPEEPLFSSGQSLLAESWTPDGRFIAFVSPQEPFGGNPGADVWVLPLFGERKASQFLPTRFAELQPRFSPDGRWMAYVSNESGRNEVYVASFPGPGGKWQVSTAGGVQPRWRRDGAEIFYLAGGMLTAAVVNGRGDSFAVGTASPLFAIRSTGLGASYDVSADGGRFLVNAIIDAAEQPVTLIVNWTPGVAK